MHARVSTYDGEADELVKGFDSVTGALEDLDGFSKAYFLVDRAGGRGISITLWESEDALNASVERANQMREEATDQAGASIRSVDHYEVALTVGYLGCSPYGSTVRERANHAGDASTEDTPLPLHDDG